MPSHLAGGLVHCFVGAADHKSAILLAAEKLRLKGFVIDSVHGGKVYQMDPEQWQAYVRKAWPEFTDHYPSQAEMLLMVSLGGVVFGPFAAWEREP
jgi:hypothetical protein